AFNTVNNGTGTNPAAGDTVFLFENATSYTGPVTLLNNQVLIGQDATASVQALGGPALSANGGSSAGNTYPALNPTGTAVTITSASTAITLGTGNNLAGFTVGNSTTAISGGAAGTLKVREVVINTNGAGLVIGTSAAITNDATFTGFTSVTAGGGTNGVSLTGVTGTLALGGGALSASTGATFNVVGGPVAINYSGNITQANNSTTVSVATSHTGTLAFSG